VKFASSQNGYESPINIFKIEVQIHECEHVQKLIIMKSVIHSLPNSKNISSYIQQNIEEGQLSYAQLTLTLEDFTLRPQNLFMGCVQFLLSFVIICIYSIRRSDFVTRLVVFSVK
jgi:hypothetical protein